MGSDCGLFVFVALPFPPIRSCSAAQPQTAPTQLPVALSTTLAEVGFALQTRAQYMRRPHTVNGTAAPADTGGTSMDLPTFGGSLPFLRVQSH